MTFLGFGATAAFAQSAHEVGGEASLKLPDLSQVLFLGIDGHRLLMIGILFCIFGLGFGLVIYTRLKNMPVHRAMREISELIYETCKTYLVTQGKFMLILWLFIAVVIVLYFGVLSPVPVSRLRVTLPIILLFSLVGHRRQLRRRMVWHPGEHIRQLAHGLRRPARQAVSDLRTSRFKAGMSIGMMLISVELLIMLFILLFIPGDYAGPCFIGFAIGESLGAAALRIAGGIFTKIADIGSDLMKIVFKIKEDDARNPGVIADCTGDNAGDSVGPSADGFETYGVTGVALITFILLGVKDPTVQVQLLVWIFVMRIMMMVVERGRLLHQWRDRQSAVRQRGQDEFRNAADLAGVDHIDRLRRPDLCHLRGYRFPNLGGDTTSMVETGHDHFLRHAGGRDHPRIGEGIYLDRITARQGSGDFGSRKAARR